MENKLVLGFWPIQELAQIPRYLLEYFKIPYTEKIYDPKNPNEWFEDKIKLGLTFPNLPYLIDGDLKLSETTAICRYIIYKAKREDFLGKDIYDQAMQMTIAASLKEILNCIILITHAPKLQVEEVTKNYSKKIEAKIQELSTFLGNKEWLFGYMTEVDFGVAFQLDMIIKFDKTLLEKYKNLIKLHKKFFKIKQIKDYVNSNRCFKKFLLTDSTWEG